MENSLTYLGRTYNDNEIISGSFSKTQSLSMAGLPVDTMEITVRPNLHLDFFTNEPYPLFTRDGFRFQTSEANPISGQFQQNTPLVQRADGSQTAIWYMQSVERIGKDVYKLNGFSSLGRLTQITHYGGIYTGQTVATVAASIIGDLPYYISAEFQNIAVYGWLPIATARDNLQQLLFAINANLQTDAQGVLRIQSLSTAEQSTIAESDIFQSGASVKYNSPVTKVVVVEHQYSVGTGTKELFNGTATGNQLITFDEPMSNLSASGLTIVEAGDNYAVVSGTGTLTGTPYIHTMREIERTVSSANVNNIVRVDNATLVGITASSDVANRLAEYYKCRNSINAAVAQAFIGVGSVVSMFDPYDEIMRSACVESERVNLSHTAKSTVSALIGYIPWQVVPFEDEQIIVTESGTVTLPEGVTDVTAVLIGGGSGGQGGYAGEAGTNGSSSTASGGNSRSGNGGKGGKGGDAGLGGSGGKVFRIELSQLPADRTFTCNIGTGGAGGAAEGGAGTAGTDSTLSFGDTVISSAEGAASAIGYQDPVSQAFFAQSGAVGAVGGKGGDGISGMGESGGADTTTPAESGESVGANAGGTGSTGYWFNGGSAITGYESTVDSTVTHGRVADSTYVSGASSYSFNSTSGTYSVSGSISGTLEEFWNAKPSWQSNEIVRVYFSSGSSMRYESYQKPSAGSYWSWTTYYYGRKAKTTIAWGKCYGGAGGGGSSGYAAGGNSASPQSATTRTGGTGASGGSRDAATIYGKGGDGGHGGGGGGGGGGSAIWTHQNASSYTCEAGVGGAGGAGGSGGAGAPGCIILYYRKPC